VDGVTRIDLVNNFTAQIHGHAHPHINEVVVRQLQLGTCFGMPTESELDLAEGIAGRLQSAERLVFTNSGTEAVMASVKLARAFTQRPMIAKCEGAYHGAFDTVEVSQAPTPAIWADPTKPAAVPMTRGTPSGVVENVLVLPFNNVEASAALIREHADRLGAILVDPMPNRVGLIPATRSYLETLRQLADEVGALLVFDEVITFRLDYHGAQGRFGVKPDLTALGKIIGGGFPIGCLAGRAEVMDILDPSQAKPAMTQGGTFTANPVTMVAGKASLELLPPEAFEHLETLGRSLKDQLADLVVSRGIEGQVTGMGSLLRIHLTARELSDYRSAFQESDIRARMARLHRHLLNCGVLIAPTGLMSLTTPMTDDDIAEIVSAFDEALTRLSDESAWSSTG
jgi:glutamate-1-semialdehyde 2,1-aminomutase